jgi:hypothetical protein
MAYSAPTSDNECISPSGGSKKGDIWSHTLCACPGLVCTCHSAIVGRTVGTCRSSGSRCHVRQGSPCCKAAPEHKDAKKACFFSTQTPNRGSRQLGACLQSAVCLHMYTCIFFEGYRGGAPPPGWPHTNNRAEPDCRGPEAKPHR